MHKSRLTNPSAMIITWNYTDRISASGAENVNKTEMRVIINTASLKSISTSKSKIQPAGSFEFRLAPTFNWVTRITVGSWCAILMSPEQDIPPTDNDYPGFADERTLKMVGRINSVRAVINVNQNTGARTTEYIVTGEDWASVFNTKLYLDPIYRNNNLETAPPTGHAARILYDKMITDWISTGKPLPSASQVVDSIIKLWGDPLSSIKGSFSAIAPELLISSDAQFTLPRGLVSYLRLRTKDGIPSTKIASVINIIDGKLVAQDTYSGDLNEALGFPDPNSITGVNTFWQLLIDNANTPVNELIADLRFENGNPVFALYRRIKPFVNRGSFPNDSEVKELISPFKLLKKTKIDENDIISVNAGTNWKDKINFVEIRCQPHLNQTNFDVQVKADSQDKDVKAFERDGFKPLFETVTYMPYNGYEPAPLAAVKWRRLIREWYFNTQNMLNGAITFIGKREYIQVGDNIEIPAKIFGAPFNKYQARLVDSGQETYVLAHVESVSHTFNVKPNGARSFFTTIQFSRGVVTDKNGNVLDRNMGAAIDQDAETLINDAEKNNQSTFGTSTPSDPDIQKLRGR